MNGIAELLLHIFTCDFNQFLIYCTVYLDWPGLVMSKLRNWLYWKIPLCLKDLHQGTTICFFPPHKLMWQKPRLEGKIVSFSPHPPPPPHLRISTIQFTYMYREFYKDGCSMSKVIWNQSLECMKYLPCSINIHEEWNCSALFCGYITRSLHMYIVWYKSQVHF